MKNRLFIGAVILLFIGILAAGLASCDIYSEDKEFEKIDYVIGVSQANMRESWRLVSTNEIKEEADKYSDISLIITDATSSTEKQKKDIQKLLEYGIDLLIVSPWDVKEMTPIISEVYQKIPVIVMDRAVEGYDYTLYIGPDNETIGRQAGEEILQLLPGKAGTVLELSGSEYSQSSMDRSKGFQGVVEEYPQIVLIQNRVESATRDDTEELILRQKDALGEIDAIFAHNDYMARGASMALQQLGYHIPIIGIDGFIGENNGVSMVQNDTIAATITCPTGGKEAIQNAMDILNHVSGVPKQIILRSHKVTTKNVEAYIDNLGQTTLPNEDIIDVGYSQLGTESAWRLANTASIKEAARDAGINLIYEDADQSQEKQIEAIRKFIDLKVDVIVLSPVVDTGWEIVLQEAKEAGIPVILSDRKISVEVDDLFTTYLGADFPEEGRNAMRWILENVPSDTKEVSIIELQGTLGASPATGRKNGFEEILSQHPSYHIVYSKTGNFTFEGGKEIIEEYLSGHEWDIDVIFAHNDDMALGAIKALEDSGIKPGVDVKIVSVDGTKEAFQAIIKGKSNCTVECTPLLGPQLMKAIKDLMSGKELPLRIITAGKIYTKEEALKSLKGRKY
ncbi:MAG: periplasmic binding protein/LacI transcriptional regulator [Herbinix sp.]|jgi:simple sugar transport system substrate-binding protein|nr:periplasmic binding protein/LacI transcriptional regulator [Herbinix sp.]